MKKPLFSPKRLFLLCLAVFCLTSYSSIAQNDNFQFKTRNFWSNVRFGGSLGMGFSDGFFSATLAPNALYKFNEYFLGGVGLKGSYAKQKNDYEAIVLGGSLMGLYRPMQALELSAQLEQLHVQRDDKYWGYTDNYWFTALYLGIGYRAGNVSFGIQYDVLYDKEKSIYSTPFGPYVRVLF
ncbi:hypothetical protein GGR32_001355 [Mesonia hippocampi]|uniref:Alpha-ketoglutarate decarboxylase n=1 Tax=Mesonia hippocampi TaxID=1628250 RepID=A0A840EL13_9FLAO|nr:alpha-ketoglutarate decarboxylase [Mesonia hippocampi]MBB4119059.1 hypothetical protein [Mesonia hippocampi]